jgi:hypothetical protein
VVALSHFLLEVEPTRFPRQAVLQWHSLLSHFLVEVVM